MSPPSSDLDQGGSGKYGLRVYRHIDWEEFVVAVRGLPTLAEQRGAAYAVQFAKVEVRSMLSFFMLRDATTVEDATVRRMLGFWFEDGFLLNACEPDAGGRAAQAEMLHSIEVELFLPSAKSVFERSMEKEAPYAPAIPPR